jgi:predicted RND superfamily exporter protein
MERIAQAIVKYPWLFILCFLSIAVVLGIQIPKAKIDPDVKHQLPDDFPARVNIDRIEEMFGGTDLIFISIVSDDILAPRTLERVKALSDKIKLVEGVDRVLSLFELKEIKNVGESMVVDPAVKQIPTTVQERNELREALKKNDLVYGSVVSTDFTATAVIGLLTVDIIDKKINADIKQVINETPGPEEIHLAGIPVVRKEVSSNIQGDMKRFMPIGLLVMIALLLLALRQMRGMLLPILMVLMSILVAMGLIPILGWKIHMVTVILPVILIAISNNYGIHIVARYQEINAPGNTLSKQELASQVFLKLASPVLFTGITTIAGLLCLMVHVIVPAEQMGVLSAFGVTFALIGSLLFIPAVLALLPKAKPLVVTGEGTGKKGVLERTLELLAHVTSDRPKAVLAICATAFVVISLGTGLVNIDTNSLNFFPAESPFVRASKVVDKHFGGSTPFTVVINGDIKHPDTLNRLTNLEQRLLELPQVDQVSSLAKVIRKMNEVMNNDDPKFDRIPDTRRGVAELLLMYENSGDPDDFDRLVDFKYRNATLTARINTQSTKEQSKVIAFVSDYLEKEAAEDEQLKEIVGGKEAPQRLVEKVDRGDKPGEGKISSSAPIGVEEEEEVDSPFTLREDNPPQAVDVDDSPFTLEDDEEEASEPAEESAPGSRFTYFGGMGVLFNDLVDAVVRGQVTSLTLSLLIVSLLVGLLFRSFIAGLLSGITLGLAMGMLFGLMGFIHIDLNIATALLSSIMIGVGVDYIIHFLWRYREERREGRTPADAIVRTLTTTGRGIIINAVSVMIGFAVLLMSGFLPVRFFGFLVFVSIFGCLVGAMVLVPTIVMVFRPRFLEPK